MLTTSIALYAYLTPKVDFKRKINNTRERTIIGSVSYRNRYWVYRIESYRLLFYRPILRASLQVQHELLTGPIKQQIKGHSRR